MPMSNTFWSLVRHDLKARKRRSSRMTRQWWFLYAAAVVLAVLAFATYGGLHGRIDLHYVWFFTFGLPFMAFGVATSFVVHEWKNGTQGWWLSLPMSRTTLVLSKFVAAIIRSLITIILIYCVIGLLAAYTLILQKSLTLDAILNFLLIGLRWNAIIVCILPFMGAFGILFGIISNSKVKPAVPLMWICFIGLWWLIFSGDNHFLSIQTTDDPTILFTRVLMYAVLASWIIAGVIVRLGAYVLDRQMDL